jgi:hypothetical protein
MCYQTHDELVELIRYYFRDRHEASEIAKRGRDHRWVRRHLQICGVLGMVSADELPRNPERVCK